MRSFKEINIKNRTYYFFDDMIYIKDFDSNLLKIEKKSYKNIDICYIGYITMKDCVKINSVNLLYLIIDKVGGHIEKKWRQIFNSGFYIQKQRRIKKVHGTLR